MLCVSPDTTNRHAVCRVLLVDDDAILRTSLAALLAAGGHQAIQAASGDEALSLLTQTQVDLVVTDLDMVGLSGLDVAGAAKQHSPPLPVILLTGWGDRAAATAPPPVHVDAVLPKPFRLEAFLRLVAECAHADASRA